MGGRMGFNVSLGTIPNYADNNNDGLLLDGVRDDSPAAKAGLKAGDKIVKLAGRDVRNVDRLHIRFGRDESGRGIRSRSCSRQGKADIKNRSGGEIKKESNEE